MITKAIPKDTYQAELLNISGLTIQDDYVETTIFKRNYDLSGISSLLGVLELHRTGTTNQGTLTLYIGGVQKLQVVASSTAHVYDDSIIDVSSNGVNTEVKLTLANGSINDSVIDQAYLSVVDT